MANKFSSLALPGVQALHPYLPGKPVAALEREYGVSNAIKLASNENPLGPGPLAIKAARQALRSLARYPEGGCFDLKQALATKHGVDERCITVGNGSNDILELLARAFVAPEHEVIFSEHAFAVYPIVTQAVGARAVVTPAKDWGYDLEAISDAITDVTKLIFIANPNNPTGTWLDKDALYKFIQHVPEQVLVVIDEAYFDYVENNAYPDSSKWLGEFDNLVVTRTFSKAYGLAGLRVGYSLSHAGIADLLNRVRQPFNVNSVAQDAALAALSDDAHLNETVKLNRAGLQQLQNGFDAMGLRSIPSVANFVAVDVQQKGAAVYDALLHYGVIVRPVANYNMPNHIRVTVGLEQENKRFLQALSEVLK